jgi:hypothetical protein
MRSRRRTAPEAQTFRVEPLPPAYRRGTEGTGDAMGPETRPMAVSPSAGGSAAVPRVGAPRPLLAHTEPAGQVMRPGRSAPFRMPGRKGPARGAGGAAGPSPRTLGLRVPALGPHPALPAAAGPYPAVPPALGPPDPGIAPGRRWPAAGADRRPRSPANLDRSLRFGGLCLICCGLVARYPGVSSRLAH